MMLAPKPQPKTILLAGIQIMGLPAKYDGCNVTCCQALLLNFVASCCLMQSKNLIWFYACQLF